MTPLAANKVTCAVQTLLKNDMRLAEVAIERSAILNIDPSKCPWIGIYRVRSDFEARTLGYGAGARRQATQIMLVAQASNAVDPQDAEDDHETLLATTLDALFSDPTLAGTVQTMTLASVEYQLVSTDDDQLMHSAQVLVTVETVTR